MEQSVIISIQGTQQEPDGSEESIELVTCGELAGSREEGFRLSYEESELTGLEGTSTTFCIDQEKITMLRRGNLTSEMVFREGERHIALYELDVGGFMMGVETQRARAEIGPQGGSLELRYVIDIENTVIGRNTFRIQVKQAGLTEEEIG